MCFSEQLVNKQRQPELDVLKGLAIIFMVFVHVWECYGDTEGEAVANLIIEFFGSPTAAPVFMTTLGIGIVYSHRQSAAYLVKRGIFFLCLGFALNFVRDFLPHLYMASVEDNPEHFQKGLEYLVGIDILPFAGLTCLFFAAMRALRANDWVIYGITTAFASLNLLINNPQVDMLSIEGFYGLFWGAHDNAWFPFLSWIPYPVAGYFFGKMLIRCTNKDSLYKRGIAFCLPLLVVCVITAYHYEIDFGQVLGDYQIPYYHHDFLGSLIFLLFLGVYFGGIYFFSRSWRQGVTRHFVRWSKNITIIYCIHWIILGILTPILPKTIDLVWNLVLATLLLLVSDALAAGFCIFRQKWMPLASLKACRKMADDSLATGESSVS